MNKSGTIPLRAIKGEEYIFFVNLYADMVSNKVDVTLPT